MADRPAWTSEQLTQVVSAAIRAGDFKAVEAALTVLAVTDPERAQAVYDTIELGLQLAGQRTTSLETQHG